MVANVLGDVSIQGMKNEIEIKTCHSIDLKNVYGPLVLNTIAGNIDVVFSGQIAAEPSSISSISREAVSCNNRAVHG